MNGNGQTGNLHFPCKVRVFFRRENINFSKKASPSSVTLVAHLFFLGHIQAYLFLSISEIRRDAEINAKISGSSWAIKSYINSCYKSGIL